MVQGLQDALQAKIQMDEGATPKQPPRGANRRPLERSWRYALNRFDRLKATLEHTPQQIFFEDVRNDKFVDLVLSQHHHWVFLSNVWDLPERLVDARLEEWVAGYGPEHNDTILSYSRPFRVRIQSSPC